MHVSVRTFDYPKVYFSTFQAGVLVAQLAPTSDRYFFSFHSKLAWPGWAAFDGRKLREISKTGATRVQDYAGALEGNLVFFNPRIKLPRLLIKIETFIMSFKLYWPASVQNFWKRLGVPKICVRNAQAHRNGWGLVLRGDVVIEAQGQRYDQELIRKHCDKVIHSVLREARRQTPFFFIYKYLPIAFARVAVFQKDYRRRLDGFGLGNDLVCTVQICRMRRNRAPDIFGATIEEFGGYRIAWNKAWLQSMVSSADVGVFSAKSNHTKDKGNRR